MNKFRIPRAALTLRFLMNKLHLSSLASCAPKACGLLLILVFGLTQSPIHSAAKARPKARLVFDTSYYQGPQNLGNGFNMPSGLGTTTGKCIRNLNEGNAAYAWRFPQTIGPEGATFTIGVAARAAEKGGGVSALISPIGMVVRESNKSGDVGVGARPGEGQKRHEESFTIVPSPAYESSYIEFKIRCHGGFDVVFRYTVEQ